MAGSRNSMAKPFLEERGLRLVALEQRHILPFVTNLSAENLREFETLYERSPLESLEAIVHNPLVYAVEKDGQPLAVTGIDPDHGFMWAMFSKDMRKHWVSFARASIKLMAFYNLLHLRLTCDVWTENEMIHQWLVSLGFLPERAIQSANGQVVIRFVRCSPEQKSVQTTTLRPVLH
jgi:hypothetical protein